jgi:hypothetical protein
MMNKEITEHSKEEMREKEIKKMMQEAEESAENDAGEKEQSTWKKPLLTAGGIVSLFLLLSYVWVTFPVGDILVGTLVSEVIGDDFSIHGDNISITFTNESLQQLQRLFIENEGQEFSLCLLGETHNGTYLIDELYLPTIYEQSFSHVKSEPCPPEALIHLHSHPHKRCIPSHQDRETFERFSSTRENALMIVMCDTDRFTIVRSATPASRSLE